SFTMSAAAVFALLSTCLVGFAASTCATSDNANCGSWVANGFCNNGAYTTAQKQAYCPNTCLNVGCVVTTTVIPTTDQNANCAKFAANPTNPFCVNTLTAAQKRFYCATTCSFEITPNADCKVYTVSNNAFAGMTPTNRTQAPGQAVVITPTGATVSRVYVGSTCTLNLYAEAAAVPGTTAVAEAKVGTAGPFQTVTTATTAASYSCTCT
ncbi:hypothetical protein PENTCL1PPCAC_28593, partial [Pristionchus entomophagus]